VNVSQDSHRGAAFAAPITEFSTGLAGDRFLVEATGPAGDNFLVEANTFAIQGAIPIANNEKVKDMIKWETRDTIKVTNELISQAMCSVLLGPGDEVQKDLSYAKSPYKGDKAVITDFFPDRQAIEIEEEA
jgi:hypothetical protein